MSEKIGVDFCFFFWNQIKSSRFLGFIFLCFSVLWIGLADTIAWCVNELWQIPWIWLNLKKKKQNTEKQTNKQKHTDTDRVNQSQSAEKWKLNLIEFCCKTSVNENKTKLMKQSKYNSNVIEIIFLLKWLNVRETSNHNARICEQKRNSLRIRNQIQ